jgi:hypothetical protein
MLRAVLALTAAFAGIIPGAERALAQQPQAGFTFALIGDLAYYHPDQDPQFENVLTDINRDGALSFVAHLGDLARPVHGCADDFVKHRHGQFNSVAHPLIFTPGDNDWTDCHDAQGVKGGSPAEQLRKLRALMFPDEQSLGRRRMPLVRQSQDAAFASYRENVRWDLGRVTFITLHVVGSNNNRGRTAEMDAEYVERNKANLAWLAQAFAHARANDSLAVMVIQQANLWPEITPNAGPAEEPSGLNELRAALEKEVMAFDRPVVLVHGDSHYFRIDNAFHKRPPRGQPGTPAPARFTRVETFGTPNHHWLHVAVDPADPNVFTFRPRIVAANVPKRN